MLATALTVVLGTAPVTAFAADVDSTVTEAEQTTPQADTTVKEEVAEPEVKAITVDVTTSSTTFGFFMNLFIASMVALLVMDNAFWFIVLFEMMSLSSWFLVIARQDKTSINAGMLYFFIAHAGSVLIMIAFLLMGRESGSLDFASFARFHFLRGWRRRCFCWPFSVLARKPG